MTPRTRPLASVEGAVLATSDARAYGLDADDYDAAALQVPWASIKGGRITMAMERMRWLPETDDAPSIFVNVANFRLWASDPRRKDEPLRMNVVVGQALDHQTPLFVERLGHVIFRPFWNPPRSILVDEILPEARPVTPENLDRVQQGRLTLRQRPGPTKSRGLAKFIFPKPILRLSLR